MDTITIIVIIILIIFIITGIYLHQEMTEKIDVLVEENLKAKDEKTSLMDEQSELKKTIRRIANDVNDRLTRTEKDVDEAKETFSLSAGNSGARNSFNPSDGRYALPPRAEQEKRSFFGQKPPGMPDFMFEGVNKAKSEGMKQNNCQVNEEMFDPSKNITPKNVEYDRMDPSSAAAERRAEGFVGNNDSTWRPRLDAMLRQASQDQRGSSGIPGLPGRQDQNQGYQSNEQEVRYQDEFIQNEELEFNNEFDVDINDEFM